MVKHFMPEPIDINGVLYSGGGLRFGGFETKNFLKQTDEMERSHPGVRAKITIEAHHLIFWPDRFAEIAFVAGVVFTNSILYATIFLIFAYTIELFRFYIFGASSFLSRISAVWTNHRLWIIPIIAIKIFLTSKISAIVLILFLVLQIWSLITVVVMLPMKFIVSALIYKKFGQKQPDLNNREGMALLWVIQSWRKRILS